MKDANCYDSFARFVGNYENDTKTDDDRLLFLARRSFPILSPPYPTLFMTLTLGLELHPFKASSVGRLGLAALLQMPQTCHPMSIGLTTYALLRYPQLLSNRPSTFQRPAYPTNNATRSRISPPTPGRQALQIRRQCTDHRRTTRLSWKFRMARCYVSERKSLWNQKIQKNPCYYGNAFLHYMILLACYCCVLDHYLTSSFAGQV